MNEIILKTDEVKSVVSSLQLVRELPCVTMNGKLSDEAIDWLTTNNFAYKTLDGIVSIAKDKNALPSDEKLGKIRLKFPFVFK